MPTPLDRSLIPVTAPMDDDYVEPRFLPVVPGQQITLLAVSIDDEHLGHKINGLTADGAVFRGQLRGIRRHAVVDRMVLLINYDTVEVHLDAEITITVGRTMPADPWDRKMSALARGFDA